MLYNLPEMVYHHLNSKSYISFFLINAKLKLSLKKEVNIKYGYKNKNSWETLDIQKRLILTNCGIPF